MTSSGTFDLLVIGAAGKKGRAQAADFSKRVAVIEQVFNRPMLSETYPYAVYDGLGNLAGHQLREG